MRSVVSRKAFQLYAVLVLGVIMYLHCYRLGLGRANKSAVVQVTPGSGPFSAREQIGGLQQQEPGAARFLLGLNYWEQLTMATSNLLSLVCVGNNWNMSTLQPFTYNSRLYGLPNFKPGNV